MFLRFLVDYFYLFLDCIVLFIIRIIEGVVFVFFMRLFLWFKENENGLIE